ncbi:LysR substrate-binding domain-containing protein [Microcella alkaliphila]|jgi:DNA-binding transcriptional LysR family regulator|uniref:Putative transcriptional regulator, LysR family n=1 Tax=Microcella alkaliphila TaxID=279828 RepID=A0A0U4WW93_9MICO|nr:LysR substrate-binding domain-containing protein [Microcella alkaliphila]BAU32074.1 putative transcriptional regulator, LysR family [Microcella alkaliphila]
MPEPLEVAFVTGVTPTKWERVWRERRPGGRIHLTPMTQDAALASLADGTAHMSLLRDVAADDELHAIPLYREQPVLVSPKGSLPAGLDDLSVADLADLDGLAVLDVDLAGGTGAEAVELVAANVGVAVMPQSVARQHSRKDVVAKPIRDAADTGISLVWPVTGAHPLADVFIGIVRGRTANSSR